MDKNSKITIFGGSGLVGSSIFRQLSKKGYSNVNYPSSKSVNLLDKNQVEEYIKSEKPEYLFMVAGLVGGIYGNMKRNADFLYQNSIMILNVLESIKNCSKDTKILYTGSTCIYPKENPQPISENRLLNGLLEESNKGYALAKILGIVGCELYKNNTE